MRKVYQFEYNGELLSEDCFGHGKDSHAGPIGYIDSLAKILNERVTLKTGNILEWGAGITTLLFSDMLPRLGHGNLLTIDHNRSYLESVVEAAANRHLITALAIDTIGPRESQSDQCLNYSTYPLHFKGMFDLIYIDGRRRLECALTAALVSHEDTVVVVHDYKRHRYQPMLMLFDVLEDGPHFRILKRKARFAQSGADWEDLAGGISLDGEPRYASRKGRTFVSMVNCSALVDQPLPD